MPSLLSVSDFATGEYAIPQDTHSDLAGYITKYEKKYLIKILGKTLYDLFIADLTNGEPTTDKYLKIFNELDEEVNGCYFSNDGMKEMLKQFIYFYFKRKRFIQSTTSGDNIPLNENGQTVVGPDLTTAYNQAVTNAKAIQDYILNNDSDYPDFNGSQLDYIFF